MITVSFIIPVYNCIAYLQNCVDSIHNAGISKYEILLIDDGSNDGSAELCESLAQNNVRIRTIHQQNSGVSAARNRGIQEAAGKYILFVDSDDTLLPFDTAVLEYLEQNVDMAMFGMTFRYYHACSFVKEEKAVIERKKMCSPNTIAENFSYFFGQNYFSSACNKFIKRSVLIENSILFDQRLINYEDLSFTLCTMSRCETIVALPEAYYLYRVDYDHDKTVDRIAAIQDLMGNTDIIANTFLDFEKATVAAGAEDTQQIWKCLLNIYFELFYVKMRTTRLADIRQYCKDFQKDEYVSLCLSRVDMESKSQKRWYHWIQEEKVLAIWTYVRYLRLRHFVARNVKRITGWRL